MESALPVTLCYMLTDLKAKTERSAVLSGVPPPSILMSDSAIIDCCTAHMIGKECAALD